nr:NBS-containing resistance-like protein [Tanacetum cinerariifolium]
SSAEAEYRGVANVVAESAWLRNLLRELHSPLSTTTLVYLDNVSAVYMSANPVQHQRMKHIEMDIHFIHDMVIAGQMYSQMVSQNVRAQLLADFVDTVPESVKLEIRQRNSPFHFRENIKTGQRHKLQCQGLTVMISHLLSSVPDKLNQPAEVYYRSLQSRTKYSGTLPDNESGTLQIHAKHLGNMQNKLHALFLICLI